MATHRRNNEGHPAKASDTLDSGPSNPVDVRDASTANRDGDRLVRLNLPVQVLVNLPEHRSSMSISTRS